LALAILLLPAPASAQDVELIMIREPGCVWCERWDAEIGPIYPKTSESRCAPIRMVANLRDIPADIEPARRVLYTPTFLLTREGQELARIEGYPGQDFFWPMLARMLKEYTDYAEGKDSCALKVG